MRTRLVTRYAACFTALLALVVSLVTVGAIVVGAQQARSIHAELNAALAESRTQDDVRALRRSGAYLSNRLFNPLYNLDVSGLNEEIEQIRDWLPVQSFTVVDADGTLLTDGSEENARFGERVARPDGLSPGEPLVSPLNGGTELWFVIGFGDTVAGYARVVLGDDAFRSSLAQLQSVLDAVWSDYLRSMTLFAVVVGVVILVLGAALSWQLSRTISQPLRDMNRAAGEFARGNLGHSLPVRTDDELGELAASLNKMATDLDVGGRLLARAQAMASLGSWELGIDSGEMSWSGEMFRILGCDPRTDRPRLPLLFDRLDADARGRLEQTLLRSERAVSFEQEASIAAPGGGRRTVLIRGEPDPAGRCTMVGTLQDVTEQKRTEDRLERLANFDALTGLPNRHLFLDRLEHALLSAGRGGRRLALLFLDLDRFKSVNDALGHAAGDALLVQAADRLRTAVRDSDTVARLGGDEFTVILENLAGGDDAAAVASKLLEGLSAPFRIEGRDVVLSGSVGITLFPEDGADRDTLVRNADSAMYQAKNEGRSRFHFFTPELNQRAHQRLGLEQSLHRALARAEFELHYQPLVQIVDGSLIGFEALLRWRRDGELVRPDLFIAVLEETGLIVPVGRWVLREACARMRAWMDEGFEGLRVGVNLSARQFQHGQLITEVSEALSASGLPASALELEITESTLIESVQSSETADCLRDMGVRLAIDDFGTGYSSLSYLKRFHVDTVKIDRSFVDGIADDPDDAAIVRAVVSLCRALNIEVLAEGVEDERQLAVLRSIGCDLAQGYLFGRPLPADAVNAGGERELPGGGDVRAFRWNEFATFGM